MYETAIEDLITKRYSTRKYNDLVIDEAVRQKLSAFAKERDGSDYRFEVVDYSMVTDKKITTYGLIKNAKSFIVGIGNKSLSTDTLKAIDFGYDFEEIILKATDLGLKTCWMGMSYSEDKLKEILGVTQEERIVMASPIGYSSDRFSMKEKLTRKMIKADQRLPFEEIFYEGDFGKPLVSIKEDGYQKALEMVRLAPSAGNAQPWRIIKKDGRLDFYGVGKKLYDTMKDKRIDFTHNDMGIAKLHFQLIADQYGIEGEWQRLNQCELEEAIYMFSFVPSTLLDS